MIAHGGTAGLALELGVLLVPLVFVLILWRWGRRHSEPTQEEPPATDAGREPRGR